MSPRTEEGELERKTGAGFVTRQEREYVVMNYPKELYKG